MPMYTIIKNEKFDRCMTCPEDFIDDQLENNETYIEGHYRNETHEIVSGEALEKQAPDEIVSFKTTKQKLLETEITLINELETAGLKTNLGLSINQSTMTASIAYDKVCLAVSTACEKFVSPGKFMNMIYLFKEQAVSQWRSDGSDELNPPELLKSWFDNADFTTYDEAATDIEVQAAQMRGVIGKAERIRLEARKAILNATGDYQAVIAPFISRIEQISNSSEL